MNSRFHLFLFFLFQVSIPGFANVQTLCWLCHFHLPLHLFGSDVCHKRVSMTRFSSVIFLSKMYLKLVSSENAEQRGKKKHSMNMVVVIWMEGPVSEADFCHTLVLSLSVDRCWGYLLEYWSVCCCWLWPSVMRVTYRLVCLVLQQHLTVIWWKFRFLLFSGCPNCFVESKN